MLLKSCATPPAISSRLRSRSASAASISSLARSRSARLRSLRSMTELSTKRSPSTPIGLRPTSTGTVEPSRRRRDRSRPVPMARRTGASRYAERQVACAARGPVGTSSSMELPTSASMAESTSRHAAWFAMRIVPSLATKSIAMGAESMVSRIPCQALPETFAWASSASITTMLLPCGSQIQRGGCLDRRLALVLSWPPTKSGPAPFRRGSSQPRNPPPPMAPCAAHTEASHISASTASSRGAVCNTTVSPRRCARAPWRLAVRRLWTQQPAPPRTTRRRGGRRLRRRGLGRGLGRGRRRLGGGGVHGRCAVGGR